MSAYRYPESRSLFATAQRPSAEEVEAYARLIAQREGCPVEQCRDQAELQLWATYPSRPRKLRVRPQASPTLVASLAAC